MESIVVDDLSVCHFCGSHQAEIHHIFFGSSNRKNSTKYKMLIGLCAEHHRGNQSPHGNREIDLMLKRMGQTAFERTGTRAEFIKIFGKNYL